MRVLVVVLNYSPRGGLEIFGRDLSHAIERLGHDVEVWSVFEEMLENSTEPLKVRGLSPHGYQAKRIYYRIMPFSLATRLSREASRFDLMLAAHPMVASSLYMASHVRPGLKYWICTYGSDIWGEWPVLLRLALKHAKQILTINTYVKEIIRDRLPSATVDILYPSVSDDFMENYSSRAEQGFPPVLLTVSRLSRADAYKGHDTVIRALPNIQQKLGEKVLYRIVGEGDGVDSLRKLADEHGVSTSVDFTGKLDKKSLLAAYRDCDIFIMPSRLEKRRDGVVLGEGFGIVYLEAAASGKPVIGTVIGSNRGGTPEAFRDGLTGIAVDPLSVTEIVDAVCNLLTDPELRLRMGTAARQLVKDRFSTEVFDRELAALLEKAN